MSESIANADEIEVTPEMIEAGALAVSLYDVGSESAEERALEVYRAMAEAYRLGRH